MHGASLMSVPAHAFQGSCGPDLPCVAGRRIDPERLRACNGMFDRILRSLVRAFADAAWLDVVSDAGLVRVASAAHDVDLERALDLAFGEGASCESQTRMRAVGDRSIAWGAPDHIDVLHALHATTFLREPLIDGCHEVLGALTVAGVRSGATFGEREQHTLETVARVLVYLVGKHVLACAPLA